MGKSKKTKVTRAARAGKIPCTTSVGSGIMMGKPGSSAIRRRVSITGKLGRSAIPRRVSRTGKFASSAKARRVSDMGITINAARIARASRVKWEANSNLKMTLKKGAGLWSSNPKLRMIVNESVGKRKK